MSYETAANGIESICSINSFYSTHSNLHENDYDECYGELAEKTPNLTHNNPYKNDDDECCGESVENMPYYACSDGFVLCKLTDTPMSILNHVMLLAKMSIILMITREHSHGDIDSAGLNAQ